MARRLLALLVLMAYGAYGVGPARADVVDDRSTTFTLSVANQCAMVGLAGRSGAHVSWASNDLDGTIGPRVDLGSGRRAAQFADPISGAVSLSFVGDGTNDAGSYDIAWGGSADQAGVCLTALTSGSISVTVTATNGRRGYLLGSDGSNLRAPVVVNSQPAGTEYGIGVWMIGNSAAGTSTADRATFTPGTTAGTIAQGAYEATPTTVADNKVGAFGMTTNRALKIAPYTPNGDSMSDETNDGINVVPVTTVTVGGKSAASTTTPYLMCTNVAKGRIASAATTEIVSVAAASTYIRFCSLRVLSEAANDVSFLEGTGTTCANNQAIVDGPYDFAAGQGFTHASDSGVQETLTAARALCIITSGAGAVTYWGKYALVTN